MSIDTQIPLEQFARDLLLRYTGAVLAEAERAGEDPGVDPVHDLRVSIRRWSQGLRLFEELLPKGAARRLRRSARPLLDAAGATRDFDIGMELLRKEKLPPEHALFATWSAERERASLGVRGHVLILRASNLEAGWRSALSGAMPPHAPAAQVARTLLPPLAADFFEAGRKATQRANEPERLHAFRLAAKRFRYTLEILSPFFGPTLLRKIEQVREIQGVLGKRQDCAVTLARIQPAAAFDEALAAAAKRLETRGARLEEQFLRFWHRDFDAPGEAERWERYLARPVYARRGSASA